MGLILELQSDALNSKNSVSNLLRKALVASKKLGISEIEEWIKNELNGYSSNAEVPSHREVRGQIKVWNPYHGWQPLNFGDPEEAEALSKRKISQTIGELDAIASEAKTESLHVPFPQDIVNKLMEGMDVPLQPTLHISPTEVVGILDTTRNLILDWALELEQKGIVGEGLSFSKEERQAASQVTYQITNNIGSMENSQIQQNSPAGKQKISLKTSSEEILKFVQQLKNEILSLELSPRELSELQADICTIETQSNSPKPKNVILKESLKSVRTILEGAAGSTTATMLLSELAKLL